MLVILPFEQRRDLADVQAELGGLEHHFQVKLLAIGEQRQRLDHLAAVRPRHAGVHRRGVHARVPPRLPYGPVSCSLVAFGQILAG